MVLLHLCGEEDVSLEGTTTINYVLNVCVKFFVLNVVCSRFLGNIKEAFDKNPSLTNLLMDDFFKNEIIKCQVKSQIIQMSSLFLFKGIMEEGSCNGS